MGKPIKSWTDVHALGQTPESWNRGKRSRPARPEEIAKTTARYRDRRKRDVEQALELGLSLEFNDVAAEYLRGSGRG